MSRARWFAVGVVISSAVACSSHYDGRDDPADKQAQPVIVTSKRGPHVVDELLIQFHPGVSETLRGATRGRVGGARVEALANALELVQLSGMSVDEAVARLAGDPSVAFAEPNYVYEHQTDDASFGQLWGLHNAAQSINNGGAGTSDVDVDAPEAWAYGASSRTVYVGVIDEGIDHRHPDLAGVVINPGEDIDRDGVITAADMNGRDDDGNGKVDDVYGWDFVSNDNTVFDGKRGSSVDAHGTHVAGTIGAVGNNKIGVVGVCPYVRVISAKFLGRRGGTTANAVKAVDYLTDLKKRGVPIVASNNSWSGGGYSQALKDAIDRAGAAGILFVAAAGNGGSDSVGDDLDRSAVYPASYSSSSIISVAAIDRYDRLTSWSNFGATRVDVGAPGATILSTTPNNTYSYYSGTSMAAPHVTGLVALLAAVRSVEGEAAKSRVLSTVVHASALNGKTVAGGRINAYRALANSTSADPAP